MKNKNNKNKNNNQTNKNKKPLQKPKKTGAKKNIYQAKTINDSKKKAAHPKKNKKSLLTTLAGSGRPKQRVKVRFRSEKSHWPLFFFMLAFLLIAALALLIIYTLFIFPDQLQIKVKNDLKTIYQPIIFEESKKHFILKLIKKPSQGMQARAFTLIKSKYGLDIKFFKIKSRINRGINKIVFYKSGKPFMDLGAVYIYWDKNIASTVKADQRERFQAVNPGSRSKPGQPVFNKENFAASQPEQIKEDKKEMIQTVKPDQKSHLSLRLKRSNQERPHIPERAKIAIIIDDVGYDYASTHNFLALDFPITFALIPGMEKSGYFYQLILKAGYDMILHIPMEPDRGVRVEDNALLTSMSDLEITTRLTHFLQQYPRVIGANNHMGSLAVTDARLMNIVIKELTARNKIWIDSLTTGQTVSKEITALYQVPYYERDVFLDNHKDIRSIQKSMQQLVKEAKEKGYAIGIGHAQSTNLAVVLNEFYARQDELHIEFVSLKEFK